MYSANTLPYVTVCCMKWSCNLFMETSMNGSDPSIGTVGRHGGRRTRDGEVCIWRRHLITDHEIMKVAMATSSCGRLWLMINAETCKYYGLKFTNHSSPAHHFSVCILFLDLIRVLADILTDSCLAVLLTYTVVKKHYYSEGNYWALWIQNRLFILMVFAGMRVSLRR